MTTPQAPDLPSLLHIPSPLPSPSAHPSLAGLPLSHTQALISIRSRLPKELRSPRLGIVCGSGLQGLAEKLVERVEVNYVDIEGMPDSTVKGHQSAFAFGFLGSNRVPVVCQLGRFHAYEGHDSSAIIYPMRLMKLLGVEIAIITNAAGGLDPAGEAGQIIVLQDHVSLCSLTSMNPLIGPNRDALGPRFPPMSDAYDFELRKLAFRAAHELGHEKSMMKEGIYAWVAGPTYETRAEQRFLRAAGADVVGMSTVPEVIAARHAGIRVLVLSLVTNIVVNAPYRSAAAVFEAELAGKVIEGKTEEEGQEVANHQEVLDMSAKRADDIRALVQRITEKVFL